MDSQTRNYDSVRVLNVENSEEFYKNLVNQINIANLILYQSLFNLKNLLQKQYEVQFDPQYKLQYDVQKAVQRKLTFFTEQILLLLKYIFRRCMKLNETGDHPGYFHNNMEHLRLYVENLDKTINKNYDDTRNTLIVSHMKSSLGIKARYTSIKKLLIENIKSMIRNKELEESEVSGLLKYLVIILSEIFADSTQGNLQYRIKNKLANQEENYTKIINLDDVFLNKLSIIDANNRDSIVYIKRNYNRDGNGMEITFSGFKANYFTPFEKYVDPEEKDIINENIKNEIFEIIREVNKSDYLKQKETVSVVKSNEDYIKYNIGNSDVYKELLSLRTDKTFEVYRIIDEMKSHNTPYSNTIPSEKKVEKLESILLEEMVPGWSIKYNLNILKAKINDFFKYLNFQEFDKNENLLQFVESVYGIVRISNSIRHYNYFMYGNKKIYCDTMVLNKGIFIFPHIGSLYFIDKFNNYYEEYFKEKLRDEKR